MKPGTLYGLGVGPGDPELVTLKAWRLLRSLPVIAYPAPEQGASFARSVVAQWLSPAQTEIAIRVPMEIARHPAQAVYDRAAAEIAHHLTEGRDVGLLCQGDPFFYGSFIQIFERLARSCAIRAIPGVSSLTACAAAARFPLASREEVLTVLPAPLETAALERHLASGDSIALIKLGRHFDRVRGLLLQAGLEERALYIERASLGSERVLALAAVDPATVPYFSMILVRRSGMAP